jgi:pyrimidine operon attenuation protein/uracil phosphoribosyltransferase
MPSKVLLNGAQLEILLHRLAWQLIENHEQFTNTVLIGLQPRGVILLDALMEILKKEQPNCNLKFGKLDTTFFRDDFRRSTKILSANANLMDIQVENKKVVFIDDVLFTGRSIRAGLTAINSYGRPESVELLVLVDRRFSRHLPIQPDYVGAQIDAFEGDKVRVHWGETLKKSNIYLEEGRT